MGLILYFMDLANPPPLLLVKSDVHFLPLILNEMPDFKNEGTSLFMSFNPIILIWEAFPNLHFLVPWR